MTADYLFIDFERHNFAIQKRSTRANLVQFMERRKETRVQRRTSEAEDARGIFGENDVIYATQTGCRYSTFGLAEIYFDVERLYRAAGYRLASHLVHQRWLGKAPAATKLAQWSQEDLLAPKGAAAEDIPYSFLFESLSDLMYTRTRSTPETSPVRG